MPRKPHNETERPPPKEKTTRKKVGDQTSNPFPDKDISTPQPPGDDNQANP